MNAGQYIMSISLSLLWYQNHQRQNYTKLSLHNLNWHILSIVLIVLSFVFIFNQIIVIMSRSLTASINRYTWVWFTKDILIIALCLPYFIANSFPLSISLSAALCWYSYRGLHGTNRKKTWMKLKVIISTKLTFYQI